MERKVGGRFRKEGTYVYLWLIHVDVWQKPTQFCKAIILRFKNKLKILKIYNLDKQDVVVVLRHSVVSDSCDPVDCSQPGSSVRGILQARILERGDVFLLLIFLTQGSNQRLLHWQLGSLQLVAPGKPYR